MRLHPTSYYTGNSGSSLSVHSEESSDCAAMPAIYIHVTGNAPTFIEYFDSIASRDLHLRLPGYYKPQFPHYLQTKTM
jgi:hypothetical protein